jgi:autophagy-related protein 9
MSSYDPSESQHRPLSGSRSYLASSTAGISSSRPFLNMLNPMNTRRYQGYAQANQAVLEEDEEEERGAGDRDDLEAGRVNQSTGLFASQSVRPQGKRRVSFGEGGRGVDASILRPNIKQEDRIHEEQDTSDDEVPQSFMIEAAQTPRKSRAKGKVKARSKDGVMSARSPPLSAGRKPANPILPANPDISTRVSIPPRPSELESEDPTAPNPQQPKQMRGLDAYERALWNWVNVYNLDAFLQEVYYYYEGKGIYCIALARALNLLSVTRLLPMSLEIMADTIS